MEHRKAIIDRILPASKYGCYFRLVELEDAEFILSLRNDPALSKYLNKTSSKLEDQISWLKEYKKREQKGEDFYIITMSEDGKTRYGLNRLYDITNEVYEFGSWLYSPVTSKDKAVLADLFCHSIAFEEFKIPLCKMSVRKKNTRVMRYAKSYEPTFLWEDELSEYFVYNYETWNKRRMRLLKILGYEE